MVGCGGVLEVDLESFRRVLQSCRTRASSLCAVNCSQLSVHNPDPLLLRVQS